MESKNRDLDNGRGGFEESVPLEGEKSEMEEGIWVLRKRVEGGFMFLGIEAATAKKENVRSIAEEVFIFVKLCLVRIGGN